jgi:hypothetical protein
MAVLLEYLHEKPKNFNLHEPPRSIYEDAIKSLDLDWSSPSKMQKGSMQIQERSDTQN